MDSLGAQPTITEAKDLPRWDADQSTLRSPIQIPADSTASPYSTSPFPVRRDLNQKIAFWTGDITTLTIEAIVNPTNETLTDKNPISNRVFEVAGPELKDECQNQIGSCRTGEAKITSGYGLPARYVIHTVGPRYNLKYKSAAESALFNCYRSIMHNMKSRHLMSVGINTFNSCRRGYPADEGAHIALRTIRRFLEHYPDDVELVVFLTESSQDVYYSILPLYFPRTKEEEELAAKLLPADIGDEFGEPIIAERMIRIADNPMSKADELLDTGVQTMSKEPALVDEEGEEEESINQIGAHPFAMMSPDHDEERKEQVSKTKPSDEELARSKYQHYLRRSLTENFLDFMKLKAFYKSGLDYSGRQVVTFIGKLLPVSQLDLEKATCYFIHTMESVVNKPYVLVYFNTDNTSENQLDSNFLKQLYATVDDRYKKNLVALFIVHPNWWFKVSAWWLLTFTASDIKDKVYYLDGIEFLYDNISADSLDLPTFVYEFDKQVCHVALCICMNL